MRYGRRAEARHATSRWRRSGTVRTEPSACPSYEVKRRADARPARAAGAAIDLGAAASSGAARGNPSQSTPSGGRATRHHHGGELRRSRPRCRAARGIRAGKRCGDQRRQTAGKCPAGRLAPERVLIGTRWRRPAAAPQATTPPRSGGPDGTWSRLHAGRDRGRPKLLDGDSSAWQKPCRHDDGGGPRTARRAAGHAGALPARGRRHRRNWQREIRRDRFPQMILRRRTRARPSSSFA